MSISTRRVLAPTAVGFLLAVATFAYSAARPTGLAAANNDATIVHVLNRLGYGPRPGEVETVRALGVMSYIEQQLHPEKIADSALKARLAQLTTLDMSSREIAREYYMPAQLEKRRQKQAQNQADSPDPNGPAAPRPQQTATQQKQRQVIVELDQQKILRAVYGERQLEQVLADFWFNHFNVFAGKGPERIMLTEYERDVIRPHVLGSFRDLLGATAHSPAMLFYLDNWMSTDPDGRARRRPTGLNENYGRELMELHTLGVDGGYTQEDVVAVARAFTGWTIAMPRQGGGYRFDPRMHDDGEKRVLGHTIKAGGGEGDGERVLDILAAHPSTATFISTKLARRFVSDNPPQALIDRAAKRFLDTHGDIREVVRTIVESPEFFAPQAQRAKVKTPFEFMASALRASSAQVLGAGGLIRSLQEMGMPLYQAQPPTGYADTADAWVSTNGLVSRMNFAVSLLANRIGGVRVDTKLTALELGGPEFQRK